MESITLSFYLFTIFFSLEEETPGIVCGREGKRIPSKIFPTSHDSSVTMLTDKNIALQVKINKVKAASHYLLLHFFLYFHVLTMFCHLRFFFWFFDLNIVGIAIASLVGFWSSLLECNSRSYSASPPLMLQHQFSGEPIELLCIALLAYPLPSEEDGFHVLLF